MRVLAWFAGAFSGGTFLAQYLLPAPAQLPAAFFFLAAACAACCLPPSWRRRGLLLGTGIALALGYHWLYIRQVQRPAEALAGTEETVSMTVCDYGTPTRYGAKVTVKVDGLPGKAVYYGGAGLLECRPGQRITAPVQFRSAARIRDDDVTTFTSKGIFLLAYERGDAVLAEGTARSPSWWLVRLGRAMKEEIAACFQGEAAAFLTAILTGDKSKLSEGASADLSEAGLYHIMAVSGMHCGFLLSMVYLLAGRHRQRLVAVCSVLVLAVYAIIVGGSPSVVRAGVMLSLLVAAPLFRRESDGLTAFATALMLILLANPFAAASISLQLSFGAVAGLLLLTPRLHRLLQGEGKHGRVYGVVTAGFSATMGALVFTIPLCAVYFGTLVLVSPLSNLLCLWAAGIVFMGGLAAVILGSICPPLGVAVGWIPGLLARYILLAAHGIARLPCHALYFANPYLKYWLLYAYVLFAAAWLMRGGGRRRYALAAGMAALTLALTVHLGAARCDADLEAVVLDVGQGQSVVLASEGNYALVDCGSSNSWYDPGERAAHQLQSMGCRQLDYLILTHYDSDHLSGVTGLLARMPVSVLLVPRGVDDSGKREEVLRAAAAYDVPVEELTLRQDLPFGRAVLTVFPPSGMSKEDNEQGLSVLAASGEQDLLITGDLSSAGEKQLLADWELPDIEAFVVGHHGSKNSTSPELLEMVQPEIACISTGSNRYGHPAPETLRRLARQECEIFRTDLQGNIYLSLNQGEHHGVYEKEGKEQ